MPDDDFMRKTKTFGTFSTLNKALSKDSCI